MAFTNNICKFENKNTQDYIVHSYQNIRPSVMLQRDIGITQGWKEKEKDSQRRKDGGKGRTSKDQYRQIEGKEGEDRNLQGTKETRLNLDVEIILTKLRGRF